MSCEQRLSSANLKIQNLEAQVESYRKSMLAYKQESARLREKLFNICRVLGLDNFWSMALQDDAKASSALGEET